MTTSPVAPPRWYLIVAVLVTLWMCVGVLAFVMDILTDEAGLAAMSEGQQLLYRSRPQWLLIVFAVATLSGLTGAIGLLMRKVWSVPALLVSLIADMVQVGYTLFGLNAIALLGAAAAVPLPLAIFLIGAAALWFAQHAKSRGWLA